jgi:hypothetical protein
MGSTWETRSDGWLYYALISRTVQERAHEVRIMGSMYANAERVLVWLGDIGFDYFEDEKTRFHGSYFKPHIATSRGTHV